MASIDLPRPLQDYFAFAETTPTREGRRFSITLPYLRLDGRIDRLQWWYHLSEGKERILGEEAARNARAEAVTRFTHHIERWAQNTAQVLRGDGPIPQLSTHGATDADIPVAAAAMAQVPPPAEPSAAADDAAQAQTEELPEQAAAAGGASVAAPQVKIAFG
ncbi:MAG TPA: hypothetical protein VGL55_16080 [Steroidobacteraceae bacterium]|jgi:hypothetical protein